MRIQESPLYETLSTILASLAPNHVLLEIDWQRRVALVHQLVPQERETLDQVMRQS